MIKLLRELLFLTMLLVLAISALLINLSFQSDEGSIPAKQETSTDIPPPIVNQLGKRLFKDNCAICHNRNMMDPMTGPALGDAEERWKNNDIPIERFIRNAPAVLESGNEYTNQLLEKYTARMTAFPNLKDEEIESILLYIEEMFQRNR